MEANTEAIIRLAWARALGLEDEALAEPTGELLLVARDDLIMAVCLGERVVVAGPADFLDQTREVPLERLVDPFWLLSAAPRPARVLGRARLAYADAYVSDLELETLTVTDDPAAVLDLEKSCPPDDVAEVGLSAMDHAAVVLDELDQPISAAGYLEWQHVVAQLGVLTPPERRRRGHGLRAAAAMVNDALDSGLVPQWRSRWENEASARLGRRLGFVEVGSQTTVVLGETDAPG